MPLLTVSMTVITILHSADVVHILLSSDFITRQRLENLHYAMCTLPMVYG
jgi:hypothetical protein